MEGASPTTHTLTGTDDGLSADKTQPKEQYPMVNWTYDLFLWVLSLIMDLFFREVHPRGSWKIPREGPVIFVAAPHANQFVDPLLLMRTIRTEAHRRIALLTAEKSMRRKFIGWGSRKVGAVPVSRAMDMVKAAAGKIYMPDPKNDPLLIRGTGTDFEKDAQAGGLLVLPTVEGTTSNTEIAEIISKEELRLKKPFKGGIAIKQLTGREDAINDNASTDSQPNGLAKDFSGTHFKTAPKVDQSKVYEAVFARLRTGGAVGIFPEGGSHDRTELLPLKAGVAIMALGALVADPDCDLKIVPCGMNYFHAHKFRSRAVIEFGNPIDVPAELVEMYKSGERREATAQLLDIIYQSLVAVTVTSPDYDTLMLIQAARRLYNPTGKKLPLPTVVELNRRLVKGYTYYKDDPRIKAMKKGVLKYNKHLQYLNLRDHQVEYAKLSTPTVIFTSLYRIAKLLVLSIGVLPGTILFAPVFIASKIISIRKSREALAASTVKLEGRDVIATWKLLVAMAFAPMLYTFYNVLLMVWTYRNRVQGYMPEWVPLWSILILGYTIFPMITFAALRFGEVGMDIAKSLRPLFLCLNPSSSNTIHRLQNERLRLSKEVTDIINELGPEMFDDFEHTRIVADPFEKGSGLESPRSPYAGERIGLKRKHSNPFYPGPTIQKPNMQRTTSTADSIHSGHLPRNESFGNLSSMGLFASRPQSRSRSRSTSAAGGLGSGGFPLTSFSTLNSTAGFNELSAKIRGAMKERGEQRQRRKSDDNEIESDGEMIEIPENYKKDV